MWLTRIVNTKFPAMILRKLKSSIECIMIYHINADQVQVYVSDTRLRIIKNKEQFHEATSINKNIEMINSSPVTKKIVYNNMNHPKKCLKCVVQNSNRGIYYVEKIPKGSYSVFYSCRNCCEQMWKEKHILHQGMAEAV